ncbi:MAG TPA: trigger factor, partial [Spirochaetia bacterium]|nr:trigger factor [Spirochaetia bacterium]
AQETLQDEYKSLLGQYAKSAQIKGFRKGHVPPDILERKFGESIKFEASQKVLEDSLRAVFEEIDEKPLPYSQPALDGEPDFDIEKDLTYSVVYDIFPEIELGEYKGLEIEVPQVSISKEDEERELKALQEQNAIVIDKEEGGVEAGNIVTVDYCELDAEGNVIEDTEREDFVFTQGSGYNVYKIDEDVLGMKTGEEKTVDKEYPEDFEDADLAGQKKKLKITVKAIKERQLPEIDDDLAQDISDEYETIADLKKDIKGRLERTIEGRLREQKNNALIEQIVEKSTIPVPESMVQAELENSWRNFVQQFRAEEEQVLSLLQAQGRTKENLLEEWREGATKRIRGQLAVQKILESEEIEVTDEEVDAELDNQAQSGGATKEQLKQYYESQNMMDYVQREVRERKLFEKILEDSKIKKGEKVGFLDLMGRNE